jgi:hypothetical protein
LSEVVLVKFSENYIPEISSIRQKVFTIEQNVDSKIDFDGQDKSALHALVKHKDSYVGTGRMLNDGHIGRVAILKDYRNKGFGADIVNTLVIEAFNNNYKRVFLGSQLHAKGFYLKLGFSPYGDTYFEANIEHILMEIKFS